MKKKLLYGAAAMMLVALFAAAGCSGLFSGEREPGLSDDGFVVLRFSDLRALSIVPELSLDIEHYAVSFTRQGFQPVTLAGISSIVTETEPVRLPPGSWQVSASAFNDAGSEIGFAEATVNVAARQTSTVTMGIQSLVGDGTLSLTAELSGFGLSGPAIISGTVTSGADETTPISMAIGGSSASFVGDFPAGTYLLVLELSDDGGSVASYVNTVLIVSEQTTSAAIAFRTAGGSIPYALFTHRSQSRYVEAISGESERFEATGFEDFEATAKSTYEMYSVPGGSFSSNATQTSTLRRERIFATGVAGYNGIELYESEAHYQSAYSGFVVHFSLSRRAEVTLTGELWFMFDRAGYFWGPTDASATLSKDGESIFISEMPDIWQHYESYLDINETLILEPGDYTLSANASAWCRHEVVVDGDIGGTGGGSYYLIELAIVEVL